MFDGFKAAVEAATVCDLVLTCEDTEIGVDATVHFADDAEVPFLDVFAKADLASLARAIPEDGMVSVAMAVDAEKLWASFEPFMTASLEMSPEPARKVFEQVYGSMATTMKSLGHGMAMSGGLKDGRIEVVGVVETPDPAGYLKAMLAMTEQLPKKDSPLSVAPKEERSIEGTKVTTLRLQVDSEEMAQAAGGARGAQARAAMQAMFGQDSFNYHFVPLEKRLLIVMGGDELLARAIKAGKAGATAPVTPLAASLVGAGPDTVGYFRMDLGAMMHETAALAARASGTKTRRTPAESVPLTVILSIGDHQVRARASVDVGKATKAAQQMKR
jgi:hypothetical protein